MKGFIRFVDPAGLTENAGGLTSEESAILDEINRKVTGAESFDAIMDFLFERTRSIFPCDRISIAFLEDNGRRVVTRAVRAAYENLTVAPGYSDGLAGSTLKEILKSGTIRVINDLRAHLEMKPSSTSTAAIVQEGQLSSLSCPLIVEERPVGFLFRNSRKPGAYSDHEVLLHALMAEKLSHAVEKAWRISQLSRANEGYMEMLAFASHELKSPLASISMECEMLLDEYAGKLTDEQRESLKRMYRKVHSLLETTNDYLSLAAYEGGQLKINILEKVDLLADTVYPAVEQLNAQMEAKQMRMVIKPAEGVGTVSCDPKAFQAIFLNLIGNGIKYGKEGGRVEISLKKDDQKFSATVFNEGPGFPAGEKIKLFKRFSRLYVPELKKVRGTGVGLYLVWQLIDLHNGTIAADSEYGKWAEFSFSVPQPDNPD